MRINARLDDDHSRKLKFLRRATGAGISDVVKQAIDLYYERLRQTSEKPGEALAKAGFVGCGEGPADLSDIYKDVLQAELPGKYGHR
jgi:hypothetical protein